MPLFLWEQHLRDCNLYHFDCLKSLESVEKTLLNVYANIVADLRTEFNRRFTKLDAFSFEAEIVICHFSVDVLKVDENLQIELAELQCDTEIKHKFLNEDKLIFYQELKDYKFPKIKSLCLRIAAICVSTYLCEHFFLG